MGQSNPLDRYLPSELRAKLETAHRSGLGAGERRIVTMLFCDVAGSTAAAGRLDPEEWAEVINGAFQHMIEPIYRYEGTVARLMGDGLLAFFGAPIAHEDDPQRAVLAGLQILEGLQPYRQEVAQRWTIDLDVRVGINTGLVVVGAMGSDLRMEYTALGDAINLAARMEQTARPGTVQIAEPTYRLVAPLFDLEVLEGIEIKGKSEPMRAYRVLGRKVEPGRMRGLAGHEAVLVGRDAELAVLREHLQALCRGVGGIVCLIGEAGLGKSRLIAEAQAAFSELAQERGQWFEVASLSYETTQPYGLIQRLIRRVCGVSPTAVPAVLQSALTMCLETLSAEDRDRGQQVLGALFGLDGDASHAHLEGETFRRELFDTMIALWRGWIDDRPTVVVVDDLHWTDSASTALLQHLFQLVDWLPVLFVCAQRPDRTTPAWSLKTIAESAYPHRTREIPLTPLSQGDSSRLVDTLLAWSLVPAALRTRILDQAAGNPFFVEEVIRALIDNGVITQDGDQGRWLVHDPNRVVDVPDTLQALLLSRIDRLEEETRRTVQLAAVIGRSFYYQVLRLVTDSAAVLDTQVQTLLRIDLIREAARIPDLEYVFKHALIQEAAYSSILLKHRRQFHLAVGEAMEALFPDRLDELAPLLAHHFREAGHDVRALHYLTLSGDAAFRLYAIPEALIHYQQAVNLSRQVQMPADRAIHLYLRLGRCLELQNDYSAALSVYEALAALAEAQGNETAALAALVARATTYAVPTPAQDVVQGRALSEQALVMARRLDDRQAEARILWNFMLLQMYSGHMGEAIPYGEACAALARQLGLAEQLAHALQDLGLPYMGTGRLDDAQRTLAEAAALWREQVNYPMLGESLANSVLHRLLVGSFDEGEAFARQSFEISDRIDNAWGKVNSRVFVALIYLARGKFGEALHMLPALIQDAEAIGHPGFILGWVQLAQVYQALGATAEGLKAACAADEASHRFVPFRPLALAVHAGFHLDEGDLAEAGRLVEDAISLGITDTLLVMEIEMCLATARLAAARGDTRTALAQVGDILAMLEQNGARYFLPQVLRLQAQLLLAIANRAAACDALKRGQFVAFDLGARNELWIILADLAKIEAVEGSQDEMANLLQNARQIVQEIAEEIDDSALRASFLARARASISSEW